MLIFRKSQLIFKDLINYFLLTIRSLLLILLFFYSSSNAKNGNLIAGFNDHIISDFENNTSAEFIFYNSGFCGRLSYDIYNNQEDYSYSILFQSQVYQNKSPINVLSPKIFYKNKNLKAFISSSIASKGMVLVYCQQTFLGMELVSITILLL